MAAPYQILGVWHEWVRDPEDMGSKKKFWFRFPGEPQGYWLFKFPKDNIVNRMPHGWMSSTAKEFAVALLCYNFQQLQELFSRQ